MFGKQPVYRTHTLNAKKYRKESASFDKWRFGIRPPGDKYNEGDTIILTMDNFDDKYRGKFKFEIEDDWLDRIRRAYVSDSGNIDIEVNKYDNSETFIYIGRVNDSGKIPIDVNVQIPKKMIRR